ncbi:MAG: hypothetical protein QM731_05145 [Chitinophagaceae bacterium]
MKRISIGFTALMAIIAMSFTFSAKTKIMGTKIAQAAIANGCYTALQVRQLEPGGAVTRTYTGSSFPYDGEITLYYFMPDFPEILLYTVTSVLQVGDEVEDPYVDCHIAPNPPLCCYQVVNNQVVFILYGEYWR